jgi:hypothetical protein
LAPLAQASSRGDRNQLTVLGVAVPRRRLPQRNLPRVRRQEPKSPGGPRLVAKRELYIALMAEGTNNSGACLLVGVNRRTGTRWSNGRSLVTADGWVHDYPAIIRPGRRPVSARFCPSWSGWLSPMECGRAKVARSIAGRLGRSPSTISRELVNIPTRRQAAITLARPSIRLSGAVPATSRAN